MASWKPSIAVFTVAVIFQWLAFACGVTALAGVSWVYYSSSIYAGLFKLCNSATCYTIAADTTLWVIRGFGVGGFGVGFFGGVVYVYGFWSLRGNLSALIGHGMTALAGLFWSVAMIAYHVHNYANGQHWGWSYATGWGASFCFYVAASLGYISIQLKKREFLM